MTLSINQSLAHGLEVLLAFESSRTSLTVSEIAQYLKYSQSSTYRLVRTLVKYNLIQENPGTARYSLGLNVLRLGLLAQRTINLGAIARPFMAELSRHTKETVILTIVNGPKGMCVEIVESSEPVRSSTYQPGEYLPLHCGASGTILMAYLSEEEWDRIIATEGLRSYTPNTITEVDRLKDHLREIRKAGFAFSDREVYQDVVAVAAPILNVAGLLMAGLSVVSPFYRINKRKINSFTRLVAEYAKKISDLLNLQRRTGINRVSPGKRVRNKNSINRGEE
jgi:DNA-binding IclR family transcriptional regulator